MLSSAARERALAGWLSISSVHRPAAAGADERVAVPKLRQDPCVRVSANNAEKLVEAARQVLPAADAAVAREAVAADLRVMSGLQAQIAVAEQHLGRLLPATPYAVLTTTAESWCAEVIRVQPIHQGFMAAPE